MHAFHATLLLEPARLMLAGYILAAVCLMVLLFVISSFYTKKIGQKSPRAGFILAIIMALCYASSILVSFGPPSRMRFIQFLLMLLCAGASAACSLNLFFIMKRVRK
jgi:hypothetical protein